MKELQGKLYLVLSKRTQNNYVEFQLINVSHSHKRNTLE